MSRTKTWNVICLVLVTGVYVLVVVGFRGLPEGEERAVLALSMVAAAIIGIFSLPVRRRLEGFANLRVYGEREAPEEALRTFATRMSRRRCTSETSALPSRVPQSM